MCTGVLFGGVYVYVLVCGCFGRAYGQTCGRVCGHMCRCVGVCVCRHGVDIECMVRLHARIHCSCTMHDSFRGLSASEGALFIEGLVGCPSGTFKAQGHRHQGFSAFLDLHHLLVQPCHHGFQGSWRFASSFRLPEAKA